MNLLLLALAPGIAISVFIYARDQYNREPFGHLLASFGLGVLAIIPPLGIQLILGPIAHKWFYSLNSWFYYFFDAFLVVALSEEFSKYFVLQRYALRKRAFDEPFDGIVYSVIVSMGFATAENIGYVMQHGFATGMIRMFMSVPAHACFAVMMGYYVGKARFDKFNRDLYLRLGILLAVIFHGLYDFFLMLAADQQITRNTSQLVLIAGAILSYLIVFRYSIKAIQLHRNISKIKHENSFRTQS